MSGFDLAVNIARERAKQSGTRLTPIREHVYRALLSTEQPLGAYEILDTMDGIGSRRPPTVYRTLDWLMEMGLVRRISSLSKFVATPCGDTSTTVAYLLCRNCGTAQTVEIGAFGDSLKQSAQERKFKQEEIVIEVMGLCNHRQCRDDSS